MSAFPALTTTPESVRVHGAQLDLSALEFIVLSTLVNRQADGSHDMTPYMVVHDAMAERFPKSAHAESNVLQVIVYRLRKKLAAAGAGVTIRSVRSLGYQLLADKAAQA